MARKSQLFFWKAAPSIDSNNTIDPDTYFPNALIAH